MIRFKGLGITTNENKLTSSIAEFLRIKLTSFRSLRNIYRRTLSKFKGVGRSSNGKNFLKCCGIATNENILASELAAYVRMKKTNSNGLGTCTHTNEKNHNRVWNFAQLVYVLLYMFQNLWIETVPLVNIPQSLRWACFHSQMFENLCMKATVLSS